MRSRLFQLGWPMTIGILANMSVPLMDSFYLGQMGTKPLAAISFTFPVVLTLMSLAIGLGAGTSSVVSRAIGNGEEKRAKSLSTDASMLAIGLVTILSIIGVFTIRPIFSLMGAEGETLDLVVTYMGIWYFGFPSLTVMMVANNLLRSNGDAKTASLLMIGIALFNAVLDPLLIFGLGPVPQMGIAGAAWASVIAQVLVMLFAFWVVLVRDKLLDVTLHPFRETVRSWWEIGRIAVPAGVGNAINPIGITIVTGFLAGYGEQIVAGFGVATRIESFASIPMLALSAAIGPIAGQNFGAGKHGRVESAHRQSYVFDLAWSAVLAAILFFCAPVLAKAFSEEAAVVETITTYLRIVPFTLAGYGIAVVSAGGLNAIGHPGKGLGLYLIRTGLLYVPLGFLASLYLEPGGVFWAIAMANVLSGGAIAFITLRVLNTER